jgi:hypothetical protein
MIHFRGNDLRAPTLHNRGECQASTVILGTFLLLRIRAVRADKTGFMVK